MKRYKVLIRTSIARRDVMHSLILSKLFENNNHQVVVASLRQFNFALKKWKPDIVIFAVPHIGLLIKKELPNCFRVLVPSEGGDMDLTIGKVYKDLTKEHLHSTDMIFFWNKKSMNDFKKTFPAFDKKRLFVSGNPKLDTIKFFPNFKNKKKFIGIATRYPTINPQDGENHIVKSLMPQRLKYASKFTFTSVYSFFYLMKVIERILKDTDQDISIRPHPLEDIGLYSEKIIPEFGKEFKKRIQVNSSLCLIEWLSEIDLLITPTSTVSFESYLMGIPTISIDKIAKIKEMNVDYNQISNIIQKSCIQPSSIKELMNLIKQKKKIKLVKNKNFDNFLNDFHSFNLKESANKIIYKKISQEFNNLNIKNLFSFPKFLIDFCDQISYKRSMLKNKLHWNANYSKKYHLYPKYLDQIVENIEKNKG